jgi:microcystin-dependent protein
LGNDDDGKHFVLAPNALYLLLGSAVLGGGGLSTVALPQLQQEAVQACYDNSQIALDVAAQHGEEITGLRQLILSRTQYRYTSEDAAKSELRGERRDQEQDRRLNFLERNHD